MARVEEHVLRLKDEFNGKLDKASRNTDKLRGKLDQTKTSVSSLGSIAARAFGFLAVGAGIKQVAMLGVEMEQTRVSFETFLGSAEAGNAAIAELEQFSNVTPFDTNSVVRAGKVLLAFGTEAENLTPTLKNIGDISAGTGKDFNELATIFGKAQVAGTLYAEDINQLVEAGVPIMGEFAKILGTTEGNVKKMASQGKLSFGDLETAFQNLTGEGGKFFNLMEKQSKTVGGRFSTLVGKLQLAGTKMGEAMLPILGKFVDFGLMLVDNTEALKTMGIIVGIGAVAWAAYNVPVAIAAIQTAALTVKQWALNVAMNANPIGLIVGGLALLGAGLVIAWRHSETFRGVLLGLWASAKVVFSNLTDSFTQLPKMIGDAFREIPKAFIGAFKDVGAIIKAVFTGDFAAIPDLLKSAGKNIIKTNPLLNVAGKMGKSLAKGTRTAFNKEFDKEKLEAAQARDAVTGTETEGLGLDPTAPAGDAAKSAGEAAGVSTASAKAPKQINIVIDSLVRELSINAASVEGSADDIREKVTQIFLEVVNDASLSMR